MGMKQVTHFMKQITLTVRLTSREECSSQGYINAYILVNGTVTVLGEGENTHAIAANKSNREVVFKNFSPFTDGIIRIYNTQEDNDKDLNFVMQTYNFMEYNGNFAK